MVDFPIKPDLIKALMAKYPMTTTGSLASLPVWKSFRKSVPPEVVCIPDSDIKCPAFWRSSLDTLAWINGTWEGIFAIDQ